MSSVKRRIRRLINGTSKSIPDFTETQLARMDSGTLAGLREVIRRIDPTHPMVAESAPAPAPASEPAETAAPVPTSAPAEKVKGTYAILADGTEFGPYKNQTEAKEAIRKALNLAKVPNGTTYIRV